MKSSKIFGGFIFYCYICIKNNNNGVRGELETYAVLHYTRDSWFESN